MKRTMIGTLACTALLLSGCATQLIPAGLSADQVPAVVGSPQRIVAVGHGSQGAFAQYTAGQAKLMAMRAAQVDAYRALAEQVYGYRISGSTTVSAFATQSDVIRTYVDAFIRGTRLVSTVAIGDGNYEATVELDLPVTFFDCLSRYGQTYADNSRGWASGCRAPIASTAYAY